MSWVSNHSETGVYSGQMAKIWDLTTQKCMFSGSGYGWVQQQLLAALLVLGFAEGCSQGPPIPDWRVPRGAEGEPAPQSASFNPTIPIFDATLGAAAF